MNKKVKDLVYITAIGLVVIVVFCLYSLGWSGGLFFDDEANLADLILVFEAYPLNKEKLLDFIISGQAGPLGRPIALASFALDGSGWPYGIKNMLYSNTLIHSLNTLLVAALILMLGRFRNWADKDAYSISILTALCWALSPLLVSSSLMLVQRMTILSSSFMLIGLWGYLLARYRLSNRTFNHLLYMALALTFGLFFGAFTKEQAVLLPVFVLILEAYWLPKVPNLSIRQLRVWETFKFIFLILPTIVIFIYLAKIVISSSSAYLQRDFTLIERLYTQPVILWKYLYLAFFPKVSQLGPFHDDYLAHNKINLTILFALLGWVLTSIIAFKVRARAVLPLLALTWYLAAHLVESTVVPLELYFEHRNYFALIIPYFAFVCGVWWISKRFNYQKFALIALMAWLSISSFVLFQVTSLYGNPRVAAEIWYKEHPKSSRAAQYLAQHLIAGGERKSALRVLDASAYAQEKATDLTLQGLQLACGRESLEQLQIRYSESIRQIPIMGNSYSLISTLDNLKHLYDKDKCDGFLTKDKIINLAVAALENPKLTANRQNQANINVFLATIYIDEHDLDKSIYYLLQALDSVTDIETLKLTVAVLNSAGLSDVGVEIINKYPLKLSSKFWLAYKQKREYDFLKNNHLKFNLSNHNHNSI